MRLEGPGERRRGREPAAQGDLGDRMVGIAPQQPRSPLQPHPADVIAQGLANQGREDAMKMVGGKAGDPGQVLQGQRFIQMGLDVIHHPVDAGAIFGLELLLSAIHEGEVVA